MKIRFFENNETGSAFTEMAVILPFFLFMVMGAVDLGRMFTVSQSLTVIAREAANSTYRDCVAKLREDYKPSKLATCLEKQKSLVKNIAGESADDFELVVTILYCPQEDYLCPASCDPEIKGSCGDCSCKGPIRALKSSGNAAGISNYWGAQVPWESLYTNINPSDNREGSGTRPVERKKDNERYRDQRNQAIATILPLIHRERTVVIAEVSKEYPTGGRAYEKAIY